MGAEGFLSIGLLFLYAVAPMAAVTIARRYRRLRWWWPLVPLLSYVVTPIWPMLRASFPTDLGPSTADRLVGDTLIPGSPDIYGHAAPIIVTTPALPIGSSSTLVRKPMAASVRQ